MANNDVIFILSFVILMEKYGFFSSPMGCVRRNRDLVFSLGYLVSNGRRVLLGGIRLDGSATPASVHHHPDERDPSLGQAPTR